MTALERVPIGRSRDLSSMGRGTRTNIGFSMGESLGVGADGRTGLR